MKKKKKFQLLEIFLENFLIIGIDLRFYYPMVRILTFFLN